MQKHDCAGLKRVKLNIKRIFIISVWFKVLSSNKLFTYELRGLKNNTHSNIFAHLCIVKDTLFHLQGHIFA